MRTQEAIKTIVKKIAYSQAPQNDVQELITLAEKGKYDHISIVIINNVVFRT
jgi:hypothetical protein